MLTEASRSGGVSLESKEGYGFMITRRSGISLLSGFLLAFAARAQATLSTLRGELQLQDGEPLLNVKGRKTRLLVDSESKKVMNDPRVPKSDFEVAGSNSPAGFQVEPIHKQGMFVHKDGQRLLITYWCDVCYIRTYVPGDCVCCRKYTDLELRTPESLKSSAR